MDGPTAATHRRYLRRRQQRRRQQHRRPPRRASAAGPGVTMLSLGLGRWSGRGSRGIGGPAHARSGTPLRWTNSCDQIHGLRRLGAGAVDPPQCRGHGGGQIPRPPPARRRSRPSRARWRSACREPGERRSLFHRGGPGDTGVGSAGDGTRRARPDDQELGVWLCQVRPGRWGALYCSWGVAGTAKVPRDPRSDWPGHPRNRRRDCR